MTGLPEKLKVDSIVEALLEIRFSSSEVSEIVIGKLASLPGWGKFPATPLPAANIPAPLRKMDSGMGFLPVLERRESDEHFIRIGDQVLSFHRANSYPGWKVFGGELHNAIDDLFNSGIPDLNITRFGLRYLNAFTEKAHGVKSADDLALHVTVTDRAIGVPFTLLFRRALKEIGQVQVRLSGRELVMNPQPPDLNVLVDVDVATPDEFSCVTASEAHSWVEAAHTAEKEEYFGLFTEVMRGRLIEQ